MKNIKDIGEKTEDIMGQVSSITDKLFVRVSKIKFDEEMLGNGSLDDLKLHLGYTKNYSDLAKVRLQYLRFGE